MVSSIRKSLPALSLSPMKPAMAPPPSKPPTATATALGDPQPELVAEPSLSSSSSVKVPTGPPHEAPNPDPDLAQLQITSQTDEPQPNSNQARVPELPLETPTPQVSAKALSDQPKSVSPPYTIPPWSEPPCHPFYLEVLKDGSIIDQFNVSEKGAYMFGRGDLCDFILEHPSISRFHAVLQFKGNGQAYLYDLGSTHDTFVNKTQVKKKVYVELNVGAVIRFGQSSRLYIFQGPPDLMPLEADLESIRNAKVRQAMQDREASLLRAKREASFAEGISWGIGEDAIEEAEEDVDEVNWQTYKGQLTEKQEKTRDKVVKRYEKIAHMKKEIDAIRAKDIAQGGLTQGQQTQIARNEQRMAQIVEELENLEETLNESIRESLGARSGKISCGKRVAAEEVDEFGSDDDEFYDRTKKKHSNKKASDGQSVETADTLLDKKEAIIKEMDKKRLLLDENTKESKTEIEEAQAGDALDAYMSRLSSQLVLDKTARLQKEVSDLQAELDRIVYLLKIADPAGEAAKKRSSRTHEVKSNNSENSHRSRVSRTGENSTAKDSTVQPPKSKKSEPSTAVLMQPPVEQEKICVSRIEVNGPAQKQEISDAASGSGKKPSNGTTVAEAMESKSTVYTAMKPQWLGAIDNVGKKENQQQESQLNMQEANQFVDYKDRNKILGDGEKSQVKVDSAIEDAAPGLIIRKRKPVDEAERSNDKAAENPVSSSSRAQAMAEDAVALLLKHTRGFQTSDEEGIHATQGLPVETQTKSDKKKPKRVLGPERPSFLNSDSDYESWVPPEGQSGDGKTSLNERYGY